MSLNVIVGIPTSGRPAIVVETLRELGRQTRPPDAVFVCAPTLQDLPSVADLAPALHLIVAERGLPRQRNAILDKAGRADVIVFFDDDFFPDPDYLAAVEQHMLHHPQTVIATGTVLRDGIGGPGLSAHEGRAALASAAPPRCGAEPVFTGYGCNMAIRLAPVRSGSVRFDERLPLYGWQEDVDFCRRLAPFGHIVRLDAARGVHLGAKSGRASGVRLGYSQVANPLYLASKRCGYPMRRAFTHLARNMAMNILRWPAPEPFVDRRGRLLGNLLALRDMIGSNMRPERILDF